MLWLCLDFPALGREALGVDAGIAVLGAHGSHRWLIADVGGNKALPAGMSLAAARTRVPELEARPRKPEAEREHLHSLAHALYRFGSPVVAEALEQAEPYAIPRWRVAVEIGASLSLFGGVEPLREQVLLELLNWNCAARAGIAPSRLAAGLLAEAGESTPCLNTSELARRLRLLPIRLLYWPAATLDALASVGLSRIGDLLDAPAETLRQRFGSEVPRDLDRLLARRAEPFTAIEPPPVFAARFELHGEVDNVETLLFPLKRMTQRFAAYLSARAVTAMHCRLELHHDYGAPTVVPLQLLSPSRDADRWFEILRERLYRRPPTQSVRELHLSANDFLPITGSQAALFDEHRLSRERQAMLEKLIARYGEPCLWRPGLHADHRPERAWQRDPLASRADDRATASVVLDHSPSSNGRRLSGRRRRPLWLLPQPKPIAKPIVEGLPERVETGWWDGASAHRDYHQVMLGERSAWVYRDLDDGRWHLQGLWE